MEKTSNNKENMSVYNALREVPEEAQKAFNNGRFSGTDINPMWRIKKLTEVFGPAGKGWYTEVVSREFREAIDNTVAVFVAINLYVKFDGEWSKPIYGEGGNTFQTKTKSGYISVSDEAFKMAYTDAISNATKSLGLGADIWFSNDKNHSTKYDLQTERNNAPAPIGVATAAEQDVATLVESVKSATSVEEVKKIWGEHKELQANSIFKNAVLSRGEELKKQTKQS